MWKLSVKIISFAAFFSFSHFSHVAKGAGAFVQVAKYVLWFIYYGLNRPQYVGKWK